MEFHWTWLEVIAGVVGILIGCVICFFAAPRTAHASDEKVVARRFRGVPKRTHIVPEPSEQPVKAAELHELHLMSTEATAGKRIGVFVCQVCTNRHIERRELEPAPEVDRPHTEATESVASG